MSQTTLKNMFFLILFFSVPSDAQFAAFIHADSRSEAMGGTGYALADDESALFYNPAGLGIKNQRWNAGASNYAEIPFNFIRTFSGYCQLNRERLIGFGSYLNFYSDDEVRYENLNDEDSYDDSMEDTIVDNARVNEFTSALGAGYNLFSNSNVSQSIGITFRYYRFHENWTNSPDYYRNFFNFDAGYLIQLKNHIRLAVVLQNLRIASPKWNFQEEIPFTIAVGAGLKYGFSVKNIHLLDIASEASIANNFYFDGLSVNNSTFNTGVEAVLFRTIAGRFGFQINKYAIKKFSITAGYGICLFNHFELHFYMNQRNGFDVIPDAGGSINFTRMLKWEKADLRWIREKED